MVSLFIRELRCWSIQAIDAVLTAMRISLTMPLILTERLVWTGSNSTTPHVDHYHVPLIACCCLVAYILIQITELDQVSMKWLKGS